MSADKTLTLKTSAPKPSSRLGQEAAPEPAFPVRDFFKWLAEIRCVLPEWEIDHWKLVARGLRNPKAQRTFVIKKSRKLGGKHELIVDDPVAKARSYLVDSFLKYQIDGKVIPVNDDKNMLETISALGIEYNPKGYVSGRVPFDLSEIEELDNRPVSEGPIESFEPNTARALPDAPPKLWPGRPPGRPPSGAPDALLSFLTDVYGEFMPTHRHELRSYFYRQDRALYDAIIAYEKIKPLPDKLSMPNRTVRYLNKLLEAQKNGFKGMSDREKAHAILEIKLLSGPSKNLTL